MARTFFSTLGVLFAALLLFSLSFLGNVAVDLDNHRDEYGSMAVEVTRELARSWKLSAIEQHYADDARDELLPVIGADLTELKPLGTLLAAGTLRIEATWTKSLGRRIASPGAWSERLAALVNRAVKVTFTGTFAGGVADVTAELKREGGRTRLWRLRIDRRGQTPSEEMPERRMISRA